VHLGHPHPRNECELYLGKSLGCLKETFLLFKSLAMKKMKDLDSSQSKDLQRISAG